MPSRRVNENVRFGSAGAEWDGKRLLLSTGHVSRTLALLDGGLATVSLSNHAGNEALDVAEEPRPDWHVTALSVGSASVRRVQFEKVAEDPWTSPHLRAELVFSYPDAQVELSARYYLYPEAQGIRSVIGIRWTGPDDREAAPSFLGNSWGERLALGPLLGSPTSRRVAVGYYNDTQHRNFDETPILKQQRTEGPVTSREIYDWANILTVADTSAPGRPAVTIVKESHKCVNQDGIDTGAFVVTADEVRVTGLGFSFPDWHRSRDFVFGWPTWTLVHGATELYEETSLAIKQFDRLRYPVKPERDLFVMANTWGTRGAGWRARGAATEENLLREIESAADIGIDVVQCDDGWQAPPGDPERPFDVPWTPNRERFPSGWKRVREASEQSGVKLGLWAPWTADFDALLANVRDGGFRYLKLDFINAHDRSKLDQLFARAERLIERAPTELRVNWDVTENSPRVGYFTGREYGCVYLANRENGPAPHRRLVHIRYTPRLTLREAWHLAHYLNTNQFQVTVQNKDLVEPDLSNARDYSHAYNAAIPLMALPIFFQETQFLSEDARTQIRPILKAYREHRTAMNEGFVFPLGAEPNDHRWTGFQSYNPATGEGYLLVFRELHNDEGAKTVPLAFLRNRDLVLHSVYRGPGTALGASRGAPAAGEPAERIASAAGDQAASTSVASSHAESLRLTTGPHGELAFSIPEAGCFLWLRYGSA